MSIFITGTDTNVGKTVVTAGVAAVMQGLGYNIGVYKPVQSGAVKIDGVLQSPDLNFIASIDSNIKVKCSYKLELPAAPIIAAQSEGIRIQTEVLLSDYTKLRAKTDLVMVEGAGGLLVPLAKGMLISDLVKLMKLPLVIVARPDLGTINHTLLTIGIAKTMGIEVRGVIINNYPVNTDDIAIKTAPALIKELGKVEILGILPHLPNVSVNSEELLSAVINNINLQKMFGMKIPKLSEG